MIFTKINPQEEHILEFDIVIQGTIEETEDIRFVIEGAKYSLSFPSEIVEGKVKVKIPKLQNIIESGVHSAKLEVVIGGKIFRPLNESVEVLKIVKIDINEVKSVEQPKIKIKVEKDSDFNVVKEGNYEFLVKDNLYYGIISESKTIKTSKGYSSVDALIAELSKSR